MVWHQIHLCCIAKQVICVGYGRVPLHWPWPWRASPPHPSQKNFSPPPLQQLIKLPAIRGYLQEDGRLIDLQDETYRMTPLIWSCVMGHDDVAAWLLARGASVDLVDSGGRSALFYASKIG